MLISKLSIVVASSASSSDSSSSESSFLLSLILILVAPSGPDSGFPDSEAELPEILTGSASGPEGCKFKFGLPAVPFSPESLRNFRTSRMLRSEY